MKNTFYILSMSFLILFASCKNKPEGPSKEEITQEVANINIDPSEAQIGLNIAFTTKAQLGKNLMGTMKEKGAIEALKFCNVKAIPLTDSMATVHNAIINRVSDKSRNPDNKANDKELKNISFFKTALANGEEISPIVEEINDSILFYYPIITNEMCIKCHGATKDIDPALLNTLESLYPKDEAVGYSENEVRGIWSIRYQKNLKHE